MRMGTTSTRSQDTVKFQLKQGTFLIERIILIAFTAAIPLHIWTRAPSPQPTPIATPLVQKAPTLEFAGITVNETLDLGPTYFNKARKSAVPSRHRF